MPIRLSSWALLLAAACGWQTASAGEVTLYARDGLRGPAVTLHGAEPRLSKFAFNDRARSMRIEQGSWELCVDADYRSTCRIFGPGEYKALDRTLRRAVSSAREVRAPGGEGQGAVELFSDPDFDGERLTVARDTDDLKRYGFNDRAQSIIIRRGRWEFCTDARFRGRCVAYGPGRYERLGALARLITSLRRAR